MTVDVLALNIGSSTLKFGLYRAGGAGIQALLADTSEITGRDDPASAIANVHRTLMRTGLPAPQAIGHRIVHGGPALRQPCRIDAAVLAALQAAAAFAPLHMPMALATIHAAQARFPDVPQIACFDTGFHAGLPEVAKTLPIPAALRAGGVERYGFHGLSCESILHQLGDDPPLRIIVAHLGSGASVTAIRDGKSLDTSMGLTPTGGVIMATRSGDLDPGILLYLLRAGRATAATLEDDLDHRSGLQGISGDSGDLRQLRTHEGSDARARLAIEMFCYSVRKQIAAMVSVLDGVDMLVFTGGIGEHDALTRATICDGLGWIGISLDKANNASGTSLISAPTSRALVRVLPSQEDEQIARHTRRIVRL